MTRLQLYKRCCSLHRLAYLCNLLQEVELKDKLHIASYIYASANRLVAKPIINSKVPKQILNLEAELVKAICSDISCDDFIVEYSAVDKSISQETIRKRYERIEQIIMIRDLFCGNTSIGKLEHLLEDNK